MSATVKFAISTSILLLPSLAYVAVWMVELPPYLIALTSAFPLLVFLTKMRSPVSGEDFTDRLSDLLYTWMYSIPVPLGIIVAFTADASFGISTLIGFGAPLLLFKSRNKTGST